MKYFTPELIERLQNLQDRTALDEWDRVAERYAAALQKTLPQFPGSMRKVAGEAILHDAEVLSISQSRDNLSITLQPELDEAHLLVLSYTLVEDPRLKTDIFSEEYRTEYCVWLYDEFSMGKPMARVPASRRKERHSKTAESPFTVTTSC